MEPIRRRVRVRGRVQGVWFRGATREAALSNRVSGWVRNLPDGRVEAYVEGEAEAVTRVERAVRQGPSSARVASVEVETDEPSGTFRDFAIR